MQVFTLGMPAIGPFSTLSWQSVHTACFAMCVLCGNGIGCFGVGWRLKKCRAASAIVLCAGVKTDESEAGTGPHAAAHTTTRQTATRRAFIIWLAGCGGS